jgi:hypothetical protein
MLARLTCLVGGVVLAAGVASPQQQVPPPPPPDPLIACYPVPKHGDMLVVPVRVGPKTYQFLVDTGCSYSAVDVALCPGEPSGTTKVVSASGKEESVPLYAWPPAWLGTLPLNTGGLVAAVNLRNVREVTGHPVYGIIGMDFLATVVMQVDFDRGELRLYRGVPRDAGAALPIEWEHNCPRVVGRLGGQTEAFVLDTGQAGALDLSREAFARLKKAGGLKLLGKNKAIVLNDTVEMRYGLGKKLTLGEYVIREPVIGESHNSRIGLRTLSRFVVTLDFSGKKLYLKKGHHYNTPNRWDLSGLVLVRRDGATLVEQVKKGSVAAAQGVRAGDAVVKVGPAAAERLTLFEMYTKFSTPNTTVRLHLVRGTRKRTVELDLTPD